MKTGVWVHRPKTIPLIPGHFLHGIDEKSFPSTQRDPVHTSTTTGLYTVSLTVIGPGGAHQETKTNYIMVGTVTDVSDADVVPGSFAFHQNYPNPFNPSTAIQFDLPQQEFVTLKVYNALGQEVAILVERRLPAGRHTVQFNAGGMTSGIYLYRLRAGGFVATKKILLVR